MLRLSLRGPSFDRCSFFRLVEKVNATVLFTLVLLFGLLWMLFHQVALFGDDWCFAGSAAGRISPVSYISSQDWNVYFTELAFQYTHWGGRIVLFIINTKVLDFSLMVWTSIQAGLVVVLFVFPFFLSEKRKVRGQVFLSIVFSAFLFFQTDLTILRESVFWITGSIFYLWAVLGYFFFLYMLKPILWKHTLSHRQVFLLMLTGLVTSSLTEQVGVLVVFTSSVVLVSQLMTRTRMHIRLLLGLCCTVCIGFAFLMCAPGNFLKYRSIVSVIPGYEHTGFIERVGENFSLVMLETFSSKSYMLCFGIVIVLGVIDLLTKKLVQKSELRQLGGVVVLTLGAFLVTRETAVPFLYELFSNLPLQLVSLIVFFLVVIYFTRQLKDINILILGLGSVLTQVVMAVSPYSASRTQFPGLLLLYVCLPYLLVRWLEREHMRRRLYVVYGSLAVLLLFTSLPQYLWLSQFYHTNAEVARNNEAAVQASTSGILELHKYPQSRLSRSGPDSYDQPWVTKCFKSYYGLPEETLLIWKE